MARTRKPDKFHRMARRFWHRNVARDLAEEGWVEEIVRLLRRVAERAYREGQESIWQMQKDPLKVRGQ